MPNRIIRESCRSSPTLALISADAERLFWRLSTVADDHGRFEAETNVIRAACFPLMLSQYSAAKTDRLINELLTANLIRLYTVKERRYGVFETWTDHQRVRSETSKYPDPPTSADIGGHPPQSAPNVPVVGSRSRDKGIGNRDKGVGRASAFDRTIQDQDFLTTIRQAYPHLDLPGQFSKMRAWIEANPARAKSDWKRFINNWLNREPRPDAIPKSLKGLADFAKS